MKGKKIFIIGLVVIFITVFVLTVAAVTRINEIEINYIYSSSNIDKESLTDEIIGKSGAKNGDSILKLSKESTINNIESGLPFIKVVNIEKKFPGKVIISVSERIKLLAFKIQGTENYAITDNEGVVLDVSSDAANYILVKDVEVPKPENDNGQALIGRTIDKSNRIEIVLKIFENLRRISFANDTRYDSEICVGFFELIEFMDNSSNVIITTNAGVKWRIYGVESELLTKLQRAVSVFDGLTDIEKRNGEILIKADNSASYIPV